MRGVTSFPSQSRVTVVAALLTQILPASTTVISFFPSDDDVMPCQFLAEQGEVSSTQFAPASFDLKMLLVAATLSTVAASKDPSDDEVMLNQVLIVPTDVSFIQVSP